MTPISPSTLSMGPRRVLAASVALALVATMASPLPAAAAFTKSVQDINPGADGSSADQFIKLGDTLYFAADDGGRGKKLWRTKGTTASTKHAKDINPGASSSRPESFRKFALRLYFSADDGSKGREPWKRVP